jgi:F-type H+-transporting ATPase subunit delta
MIVASRYAKSLIDLAVEQGKLEAVQADMRLIHEVCKNNPDFVNLLESPVIKTDKKKAIFAELFKGKISDLTMTFVNLITDKRREGYIDDIAKEFNNQYKSYKNILTAVITSANGIDAATKAKVLELVKSTTSGEVDLIEKTDRNLLGGFVLTVGDKQIDASVARKLNNLRKNFTENPFVSEI